MKPALEVIAPGLHTTIQDAGRSGFQDIGVPASGPLDRISFRYANALVGNAPGAPALEMLLQGPTLKVLAGTVRIAVVGGASAIEIRSDTARSVPGGQSATLKRGDIFRVGAFGDSVCAYLAISGGLDVAPVLGSVATYVRGGIGGFEGRRLAKGDLVPLRRDSVAGGTEQALPEPLALALDQTIRVVLGPQADYFTDEAIQTFLSAEYTISPQADRMGYRLAGAPLAHAKGYNIVSDGIVSGAVQVPGSGQPIVLMVDNQTTGGYPKLATVISADIPVVGRRKPGRTLRFAAVDVCEAELLRTQQEATITQVLARLRPMI